MAQMKIFNLICLLFFMGLFLGSQKVKNPMLNSKEVVQISKKKAIELGYDISAMDIVLCDQAFSCREVEGNDVGLVELIKKYLQSNSEMREKIKNIKQNEYWIVAYMPKKNQLGGDLWIFIDKEDGRIITIIRGQ